MTYGVIVTMPCPVEMYDSLHQALIEQTSGDIDGMLLHVGRAVPEGFEVIEVWESKEQSDRYNQEVVWPLTARVWHGQPMGESLGWRSSRSAGWSSRRPASWCDRVGRPMSSGAFAGLHGMDRHASPKTPNQSSTTTPTPLDQLPRIGASATRALAAAGYTRLRQLADVPPSELLSLHGVGPKALRIIDEELGRHGLSSG